MVECGVLLLSIHRINTNPWAAATWLSVHPPLPCLSKSLDLWQMDAWDKSERFKEKFHLGCHVSWLNSWWRFLVRSRWQKWRHASWSVYLPVLSYILRRLTQNTNKCVIGLYAGVTCCIHKLIGNTLCHPDTFISSSGFTDHSLGPTAARVVRVCAWLKAVRRALSHIACNLRKYIRQTRCIRSISGWEESKRT